MDKRLTDALAFANYRLTLQVQRQNIDARINAALLVSYQNAIFKSSLELISFVGLRAPRADQLLVEDNSGNVIQIENPNEFLTILINTYDSGMELKQQELQKLKSARSTAKIVGL
jgi:hypothetical protein